MPSSKYSHHYHSPPPYHHTQYDSNLSLPTVAACVLVSFFLLYRLLADYLPDPLLAVANMAGILFGPQAREHLQSTFSTFATNPRSAVSRAAANMVGRPQSAIEGGTVGGLWNVGNTCYQNSVLQALASLGGLKAWLRAIEDGTAAEALERLVDELNEVTPRPRVETASTLITQASGGQRGWMFNEQQDAQEFLQGLMGVLEKEVGAVAERKKDEKTLGLEGILERPVEEKTVPPALDPALRSPFEGLLAQRVGCLRCGYVESISMQPFTTLSLPIPSAHATTLEDCLRAFTSIEQIPEVDCDKCTLKSAQKKLANMLHPPAPPSDDDTDAAESDSTPLALPEAVREVISTRLQAVTAALEDDNFNPIIPGIKLTGAHKVSSTKTKQVMIARAPPILVLHTNRSQFNMRTGMVGKNYAAVRFPAILDLGELGVVTRHECLSTDPGGPISLARQFVENQAVTNEDDDAGVVAMEAGGEGLYELKAVVAHYGGHHNGHYVAYRCWAEKWWRISDDEVTYVPQDPQPKQATDLRNRQCDEDHALAASNAFMLFYERVTPAELELRRLANAAITDIPEAEPEFVDAPEEELELALPPAEQDPLPPLTHRQLPTPSPPEDEDDDDVPHLTHDASSRESSPETPPPSSPKKKNKRKKKKKKVEAQVVELAAVAVAEV